MENLTPEYYHAVGYAAKNLLLDFMMQMREQYAHLPAQT
jgi:hypothetical protein